MVRGIHSSIRVIKSNNEIEKYFNPLTQVPMSFIYDHRGKEIYGDGGHGFVGIDKLKRYLQAIKKQ